MYTGPRIVRDGLILHLDAANEKSFKGEPTVNLQDPNINNWTKSATVTQLSETSPINSTVFSITDNSDTTYLSVTRNITVANDSSTYTISIYIKKTYGATSARLGFNSGFSGGATLVQLNQRFNSDTGVGNVGTTVDLGTWWRWSFQLTNNSSGNTTLYCSFFPATGFYNSGDNAAATGTAVVSGVQIEQKAYATPFVNGTRGTTVATGGGWRDITRNNNNGTLATNITYVSDNLGALDFNGVDSVVTLSSLNLVNCDYSVEAWFKCDTINRVNGIIGDLQFDWWAIAVQANNTVRVRHKESDALGGPTVISITTVAANRWYHVSMTFSLLEGMKLYINGKLDNFTTNTQPFTLLNRGPQFIGQYRGGSSTSPNVLDGKIGLIKIHKNKALTSEEVLQNYEATKSRFGL